MADSKWPHLVCGLFIEAKKYMKNELKLFIVNAEYIDYLREADNRVSKKYGRPYVVLTLNINNRLYAVPLTSQTNEIRIAAGKKPRSNLTTMRILDQDKEIADLLFNNMFPVKEWVISEISIDSMTDTYILNEIRFIRKKTKEIYSKAKRVYLMRTAETEGNYSFLDRICCDFQKLEALCDQWSGE